MFRIHVRAGLLAASLLPALFLAACDDGLDGAGASEAAQAPPPSPVGTIVAAEEDLRVTSELPGRIHPTQIAEVRPRVGGIIKHRDFQQGTMVAEGDLLFEIDPITYQVAVEAARAGVARAEAVLVEAKQQESRSRTLTNRKVASKAQLDSAVATRLQAEAELAAAKAELHAAEINLDFTRVTAPISGRIGRALVTEGALVAAGGAEILTRIHRLDPVYADIQQPVSELLRLRRMLDAGELHLLEPGVARVRLYLDDNSEYAHEGRLLFAEAVVERTSGQVTMRAEFPNPDGILLPGMYVRVAVDQALETNAIAVPSQAIQRDASGKAFLYLVDAESKVAVRPVTLDRAVGNRRVVRQGLAPGERVIVDGVQKIGPGMVVTPLDWNDPTAATAEPAAPGTADKAT